MATEPPTSQPESSPDTAPTSDQPTVNLQIVSPSVGVNRPLLFTNLAASTTVKQLKNKIRHSLPLRPADENQRLIHRGRAIVRESDSLLDIFGAENLRNPEQQTIHLVIRDAHDTHTPTPAASVRGPSPSAPVPPASAPRQNPLPLGPQARRAALPPVSVQFPQPRMPSPSPIHTPEQAAAFQHQHQNMTQWLTHLQREAMARALVHQNQRDRAQMGMRGIGDTAGNGAHVGGDNSGRGSPAPGHTTYREQVGPNGHTYQVETVIRTSGPATTATATTNAGGISPAEAQTIIRRADISQTAMTTANPVHRSASNSSLNRPSTQPGGTTPIVGMVNHAASSGSATPDPAMARAAGATNTGGSTPGSTQPNQGGLDVYILNSPEGPRALLLDHSNQETLYTPRMRNPMLPPSISTGHPWGPTPTMGYPGVDVGQQNRFHHHHHHHHHHPRQTQQPPQQNPPHTPHEQEIHVQAQDQAHVQQQPQPQAQPQAQGQDVPFQIPFGHPVNPPVAAIPPLLFQVWPQIWLLFRLALFVWFFTSPTATWSRWLTIICVAVFIFVLSTGALNGLGDLTRRALGQHLENLIPPLDRQHNAAGNQRDGAVGHAAPDPAAMAARLVAERQARETWVTTQLRRGERAILLFIASIAPGVAERHIANLEAQERAERAERERREAEAAESARAGEEPTAAGDGDHAQDDEDNSNGQPPTQGSDEAQGARDGGLEQPREQLVEI